MPRDGWPCPRDSASGWSPLPAENWWLPWTCARNCLLLYPLPEWETVQEKLDALPNMRAGTRWLQRILIGHATDLELDGNGRILLPGPLREHCGLSKGLVLVGQGNKVEIWAQNTWKARVEAQTSEDNGALLAEGDEITGLSV